MNSEYLLDAIGLLDDDLIREAETCSVRKRSMSYKNWAALAASLVLVLTLGYGVTHIRMGGMSSESGGALDQSIGAAGEPSASGIEVLPAPGGAVDSNTSPSESQGGGMPEGTEPDSPEGSQGDYCAAIMVDGILYWSTDTPVPGEVDESAIRTVTSYTDTVPEEDGQTNFDRTLSVQYAMTEGGLLVRMNGAWILFDPVPPWKQ